MAQKYTMQRSTAGWPMIGIAAINAYKIWMILTPSYESGHVHAKRKFLLELGKDLAKENMLL